MSWEDGCWGQKTFDAGRFAQPGALTERLHKMGIRFMLSVWPSMSEECDDFSQFRERGLLLPGTTIYDAFSPETRALYWRQAETGLFRHGVDAWWCDSCEPVTPEWDRTQRSTPEGMYREFVENAGNCMPIRQANAYGYYHARGVYEGQRRSGSGKRVVNLIRSGYWGSQKYGVVFWSGDTSASWETLKKQIAAGLHFCASGLPYWTLDIGAFFVKRGLPWYWNGDFDGGTEDYGYRELYVRWLQYGAFLPVFRSHGTDCRMEPWNFGAKGEPFYEAILSAIRLRYRLMPYIYSLAGQVWHDNRSIMCPLVSEFPKDQRAARIMDQYMFGPSLMVCPVTEPMYYRAGSKPLNNTEKSRQVWLPGGCDWYDLRTDERYAGGQTICARADIDSIPVFVRAGSILPVAEPGCSTDEMEGADICLRAYSGADGSFTLYEDAGDGYGYEKGEYCLTYLTYDDAARRVEWRSQGDMSFRKGTAYTAEPAVQLLDAFKGDVAVILGLCYGLRKSEALGLRWSDVDFEAGTLTVQNTVTRMKTLIEHEQTKNAASRRVLYLMSDTVTYLEQLRRQQEENRQFLGEGYVISDHICVWPDGRPVSPDYVSQHFKKVLLKNNLQPIRFHDLRHTAGSLLMNNGATVKQVQKFLRHEKASTTLDIYTHIDAKAKQKTALSMEHALKGSK